MMRILFIACMAAGLLAGCRGGTARSARDTLYPREAAFIREVFEGPRLDSQLVLVDAMAGAMLTHSLENMERAGDVLTPEERDTVRRQMSLPGQTWTAGSFPGARLISQDTVQSIFRDTARGWNYFYKVYGPAFYTFSRPVFLRGDSLCVFYSATHCGGLCGSGELSLYRKEGGRWVFQLILSSWIS